MRNVEMNYFYYAE